MRHLPNLILLVALSAIGCDSSSSSSPDAGARQEGLCAVRLEVAQAAPGELLVVRGLALGEADFAVSFAAEALEAPVGALATYVPTDGGRLEFLAPAFVETMDVQTEFQVELHIDGGASCVLGLLEITPLPPAGQLTFTTLVDELGGLLDQQQLFLGITDEMLDNPPPEMARFLAPLIATRYVLRHPDNPDALTKVAAGTAENIHLDGRQRELLNRTLSAAVAGLPPIESLRGELRAAWLASASIADCGVMPPNISTAEELQCWLGVQQGINVIFGSQAAKYTRAAIGVAIGIAGVFTAGSGAAVLGMVNFVLNQLIDALENLLPSKLVNLSVDNDSLRLCEGESGDVSRVTVSADNNGWTISAFTIIDGVLASVGVGYTFKGAAIADDLARIPKLANLTLKQREAVEKGAETLLGTIRDVLINFTGLLAPGTADIITIGKTRFGPVPLPDTTWFTLTSDDDRMTINDTVYKNEGTETVVAQLKVKTHEDRFSGRNTEENISVKLVAVEVQFSPVYAKPEETIVLDATVSCLDEYALFFGTQGNNSGEMLDRDLGLYKTPKCDGDLCTYEGEIFAKLVSPATLDLDRVSATVTVADCCIEGGAPPPSCTREEFCACDDSSEMCEDPFSVVPSGSCVALGSTTQFGVVSDFGEPPPVMWTATAIGVGQPGMVDEQGRWTAPATSSRVVVRATSIENAELWAEASILATDTCGAWTVSGTVGGTMHGDVASIPVPRAVPDGDGNLIWNIALTQSNNEPPSGFLVIRGHPGLDANCAGPTGDYEGAVGTTDERRGLVSESLTVTVSQVSAAGVRVSFRGDGEFVDMDSEDEDPPSFITGEVVVSNLICMGIVNPDPIDEAVPLGLFIDLEDSTMCIEAFERGNFTARTWAAVCAESPGNCAQGRCPAQGRVARCDLRALGAQAGFPQIQHYYPGEGFDLADFQQACQFLNGVWHAG